MAKRRKVRNKTPKLNPEDISLIGGVSAVEETIEKTPETFEHKPSHAKKIEKVSTEKVEAAPQTYIEDTFDLDNQANNQIEIENEVKKKQKKFITKELLLNDQMFLNKLQRAKSRIETNKGFDFLIDFVSSTKAFKMFDVDEKYDDFDILLEEIVKHFRIRLARINLSYTEYQEVEWYFERLQNLYNEYKHSEMVKRKELNADLEKMKKMSNLIRWKLF